MLTDGKPHVFSWFVLMMCCACVIIDDASMMYVRVGWGANDGIVDDLPRMLAQSAWAPLFRVCLLFILRFAPILGWATGADVLAT